MSQQHPARGDREQSVSPAAVSAVTVPGPSGVSAAGTGAVPTGGGMARDRDTALLSPTHQAPHGLWSSFPSQPATRLAGSLNVSKCVYSQLRCFWCRGFDPQTPQ